MDGTQIHNWLLIILFYLFSICVFGGCDAPKKHARPERSITSLEPLSNLTFWLFKRNQGDGIMDVYKDPNGDFIKFESFGNYGMAATVNTVPLNIEPGREYFVSMDIKTEALEPVTAKLVGGVYFYFSDAAGRPAGWYPATALFGPPAVIAPRDTDWKTVTQVLKTPTTAGSGRLFLAYGAYGTWDGGHPRETGRARGRLWIRNVTVEPGEQIIPLPPTIHVPYNTIQTGIETAFHCLHNSSLNEKFVVSDGYTISGNIVPDLTFGLFGVRRAGYPQYMKLMQEHWKMVAATINDDGRVTSQRVMSQVFFPIGIDEIFSFTGDLDFLREFLPLADKALDYVARRADDNGLARLVDYNQWRIGEGADWVDWYPTRMEGKTFNFHQWYVRALRRIAALHEEFSISSDSLKAIGDLERAKIYRARATQVETSLRTLYWRNDHFIPNIDYGGKDVDEAWCDDQVWAIRFEIASSEQRQTIWKWIDRKSDRYEGVPMRWASFEGPQHGALSWFGRTGAGDILARYYSGQNNRGLELITRISEIFARDNNIYEAYDMDGNVVLGTDGWGNYTEHGGGYIWSVIEGPFGISFESDSEAKATIRPQIPQSWKIADAVVIVRGTWMLIKYQRSDESMRIIFDAKGQLQPVRIILSDGTVKVINVGTAGVKEVNYY